MSLAAVSPAMANGEEIQCLMASLVKGIYAGAPNQVEARKIAQALAGAAWCAERGRPVASSVSRNDLLESTLTAISRLAGRADKFRIEEAKRWLRDGFGEEGRKFASRLGKLSKVRNSETHSDDMIIDEVNALVKRCSEIQHAGSNAHFSITSEGANAAASNSLDVASVVSGQLACANIFDLYAGDVAEAGVQTSLDSLKDKSSRQAEFGKTPAKEGSAGPSTWADVLSSEDESDVALTSDEQITLASMDADCDYSLQPAEASWGRLAISKLGLSRIVHLRELVAAPASGRAMVSRTNGHSSEEYEEDGMDDLGQMVDTTTEPVKSTADNDDEGSEALELVRKEDPALATFLVSMYEAVGAAPVDRQTMKRHCNEFMRARMAEGDDRAAAKAEALGIMKDFLEVSGDGSSAESYR